MLLIFFCIAFNYNILRAFKDSLVVTASGSGAEAIPYIKVWAILPMALAFTFLFTRLANRFSREKVFYVMMGIFLGFFFIFTFFLFPAREALHPHELADKLEIILPAGMKGLIAMFRNWTFTAFYVMSELWSTAILTVLFWGFANEVTSVPEAKRFYGILSTGANLSAICAGQASILFAGSKFFPQIHYGETPWEQSILLLNSAVILSGLIAIGLFYWLNRRVLGPEELKNAERSTEPVEKIKMSMRKNFAYLAKSKYLICIALIVLTYNIAINLIEVVWKNQVKMLYPDPNAYSSYMGEVLTITGVIAAFVSVLLTTKLMQKFSWTQSALIPPMVNLFAGVLFFAFVVFPDSPLSAITAYFQMTPLFLGVAFGTVQNCLARASKYTFYDATKEMAFIPLNNESKLKGKAAIDGVGSRLGKSGGSILHQSFLMFFSTVAASTPYIAGIFLLVVAVWIGAVVSLGRQFDALTEEKKRPSDPADEFQVV